MTTKLIIILLISLFSLSMNAITCSGLDAITCYNEFGSGCVWTNQNGHLASTVAGKCMHEDNISAIELEEVTVVACSDSKKVSIDGSCKCREQYITDSNSNCIEQAESKRSKSQEQAESNGDESKEQGDSSDENIASDVKPFKSLDDIDPQVELCLDRPKTEEPLDSDNVWIEYRPATQSTQTVVFMGNNQQNQQASQNMMKELEAQCKDLESEEPVALSPKYLEKGVAGVEKDVLGMKLYRSDCRDRRSDDRKPLLATIKPCSTNQIKDSIKLKAICKKMADGNPLQFGHSQGEADFIPIKANSSIASGVSQPSAGASGLGCKGTPNAEDYDHCRKSVNAYNAFGTAETALKVIHNLKMTSTRAQLQQQVAESEGNTAVAREVQIRDLRQQFAHNNQMTGLYATQSGAVLTKAVIGWPTISNLGDKHKSCEKSDAEAACCQLVAEESPREVMPNQSLKGYFAQLTAALSSKILQLQMRNNEIIEQLKQLGDNVADLPLADTGINTLATYCQSPQGQADTAQCAGVLGGPSGQATGFNSFGGGVGFAATDLSDLSGSKQIANLERDNSIGGRDQTTIGEDLEKPGSRPENSDFLDNPRGASFGQGNGAGGGGGGGGGGGAGGGSGPGLSQKPSNRQGIKDALTKIQEGGSYASSGKGFYKSSGKRKGRKSRRGGRDKSRRNLSELGGLLSKRSGKKSPVGPKNIAIFEQISGRYEAVSEQGRVR